MLCEATPIAAATAASQSAMLRLNSMETNLVLRWNQQRRAAAAGGGRVQSAREPSAGGRRRLETSSPASQQVSCRGDGLGSGKDTTASATTGGGGGAAAPRVGATNPSTSSSSSSASPPSEMLPYVSSVAEWEAQLHGGDAIPLQCATAPFPQYRTTGNSLVATAATTTTAAAAVSGEEGHGGAPDTVTDLPVGVAYYNALRSLWRRESVVAVPPLSPSSEMEREEVLSDAILDALDVDIVVYAFSAPVPLQRLVSLANVAWEDEGLYDELQRREHAPSTRRR